MLTIHHLAHSQSERIVWLCEELGLDYELKRYERDAATRGAPAEYLALHPMGLAPTIRDGDRLLAESGAIVDYLISTCGGRLSIPPRQPAYADYLYWFHFANGTLVPSEIIGLVGATVGPGLASAAVQSFARRAERGFAMIEERLAKVPYFAGDEFTAADIMMFFPLGTMRLFSKRSFDASPNTRDYVDSIKSRPAWRRAMAKAEPGIQQVRETKPAPAYAPAVAG